MGTIRERLTRTSTLLLLLFTGLFMTGAFFVWAPITGGWPLLDGLSSPDEVIARIASMSEHEISAHYWMTLVWDMPYPFIYVAFFSGVIMKAIPGSLGWFVAAPVTLLLPIDLAENILHLIALSSEPTALDFKQVLTSVKGPLFRTSGLISLVLGCFVVAQGLLAKQARAK